MSSLLYRLLKRGSGAKPSERTLKSAPEGGAVLYPPSPVPFALTEAGRNESRIFRQDFAPGGAVRSQTRPESQDVKGMPDDEHDEQELEDAVDDEVDDEVDDGVDDDADDEDEDDEDTEDEPEPTERPMRIVTPEVEVVKPGKFTITKMLKSKSVKEDGTVDIRTMPRTIGDVYTGEPPGKDDIEALLLPLYGGGEYIVINQSTKKVHKRFKFDGPARDPDEVQPPVAQPPSPLSAIFQSPGTAQPMPALGQQPAVQSYGPLDRIQWAMAQGSVKAVEQLANLAEKYADSGDTEKLNVVVGALKEIATGRKETSSSDKLTDMLEKDRSMMMQMLFEKSKGKESSSSDIVRETMSTMKEMFGLAKEFAPGEDTGVQMVREVSGVVRDGLKEVSDTVIQVTGSRPLKQLEQPVEEKVVYKCEKCGHEVQSRWALCPYCGVKFTGIVTPPPAPSSTVASQAPTETFHKPAPPLPAEIRDKVDYLRRLAVFIQENHNASIKGSALFRAAGPEEKLMLLFTANFGYANILKLAQPWRYSQEIPECEAVFRVVESPNGRLWMNKFFAAIRGAAEEEGIVLDRGAIDHYLAEMNRYSVVKFSFKPKPQPGAGPNLIPPPEVKSVKGTAVAMSTCPICQDQVPTLELKEHLFQSHPKKPSIVDRRVTEAIKQGAALLPRASNGLNLPPLVEQESLAPNGDGTEDD